MAGHEHHHQGSGKCGCPDEQHHGEGSDCEDDCGCNEEEYFRMPLIGDKAPSFEADTTMGKIRFPEDYAGKWVIFFSHPADFTPVCTTEFMTFASMHEQFRKMNAELLGLSIDSTYSHIAWLRIIKEKIEYRGMQDIEVKFPVISDLSMEVSMLYGMLQPGASNIQAVRAVFFIDPEGTVRALLYYPMSNGRNVPEIKRLLAALQMTDKHNVATPADWLPGEDVIIPPPGSCGAADERVEKAGEKYKCHDWFLCTRPDPERNP